MRIIDLIRNINPYNVETTNEKVLLGGLLFEIDSADVFNDSYDLIRYEDTIVRYIPGHDRYFSIGIGTRRLRGWINIGGNRPRILLDIQEIINNDDSYLVLKYGKILLEEV